MYEGAIFSPRTKEQEWSSGESSRLPPMWPRFESWRRRQMWVEFVVGSLPCSERFFSGYSGFPLRKLRKKPLEQLMGHIPCLRVTAGILPFSNTAIDMFGPCCISCSIGQQGKLMAFRRFASLRGHRCVDRRTISQMRKVT